MAAQQLQTIKRETEQAILDYASKAHTLLLNQFSLRSQLEYMDRVYMRENDYTEAQLRARLANRRGDARKIQDVTTPIIMPQVESALGYMVNVFCTGYPLFGVSADPQYEDAALQMETIIAENAVTAGWARHLMMFFRDGLKYNLHAIECEWAQEKVWTVATDASKPNSAAPKETLWNGNRLKRMDLYNTFFDPRIHPTEIHSSGEYAGYIEMYSRIRMKKYINDLFGRVPASTSIRAFESNPPGGGTSATSSPFAWYQPIINPFPLMDRLNSATFDWLAWSENTTKSKTIRYSNVYEVMKLYARILPSDFGLPGPEQNTPQVWKFIIVNGQVVLFAERQDNVHNFIPIFFGQPIEDGLDYQTKSFAGNVEDLQAITSAMWNGYMASKRRLVGDRVLYDPIRIRKEDINSTDPAAKIPVRPAAYGKPLNEAVYQFPFRDEQVSSLLEGSTLVTRYADVVNGQNPAQQGQFVKGNKTKHEYEDVMGHGNSRNQSMALMTEAQVFTPMKEVIKLNILQYQPEAVIFNRDRNAQVEVKPVDLRKAAVHFKVSDGLVPTDKQMSGDEFQTALQVIGSSPPIAAGYNVPPLFTYIMKTRGADLRPFEKPPLQIQYEQQMAAWQNAAAEAAKAGAAFSTPMPQIPPELQQQTPAASPDPTGTALEATKGS